MLPEGGVAAAALPGHGRPGRHRLDRSHRRSGGCRPTPTDITCSCSGLIVWGTSQFASYAAFGHRRPINAVVVVGLLLLANMSLTTRQQLTFLVIFSHREPLPPRSLPHDRRAGRLAASADRRSLGDLGPVPPRRDRVHHRGHHGLARPHERGLVRAARRRLDGRRGATRRVGPVATAVPAGSAGPAGRSARPSVTPPGSGRPGTRTTSCSSRSRSTRPRRTRRSSRPSTTTSSICAAGASRRPRRRRCEPGIDVLRRHRGRRQHRRRAHDHRQHHPELRPSRGVHAGPAARRSTRPPRSEPSGRMASSRPSTASRAQRPTRSRPTCPPTRHTAAGPRRSCASPAPISRRDQGALWQGGPATGCDGTRVGQDAGTDADVGRRDRPYDVAVRIRNVLRDPNQFKYSTDLSGTRCDDASMVECFMKIRVGFCQWYATTMAVFLRSLDIPARFVQGFLPGPARRGRHVVHGPLARRARLGAGLLPGLRLGRLRSDRRPRPAPARPIPSGRPVATPKASARPSGSFQSARRADRFEPGTGGYQRDHADGHAWHDRPR